MERAEIDLKQLKRIVDAILDTLIQESASGSISIDPHTNNYWEVLEDDFFNLSEKPSQLGVGSLFDDLSFLGDYDRQTMEGQPPIIYMLTHIVPILKFLAIKYSKPNSLRDF